MKIALVIPAFNEEKNIREALTRLKKIHYPIFVVDDGSSDSTYKIIRDFNVTAIRHKINLGKGSALKTGCEAAFKAGMEAVIIMDSDGQHLISDLPKFINTISSNKYDIVFGSRNLNLGIPIVRFVGNKMASVLISLLFGIYISDLVCGYRAFTKKAYEKINWQSSGYGVETEMVVKTGKYGLTSCEVPVETVYYDKFKGVTVLDAFGILFSVMKWRLSL